MVVRGVKERTNRPVLVKLAPNAPDIGETAAQAEQAGADGTPVTGDSVDSLAEVAKFFSVSERTAASWRAKGMPGQPGNYPLTKILNWRRQQPDGEAWFTGNPKLKPRPATGDLCRAIYKVFRSEIPQAAARAKEEFICAVFTDDLPEDDRKAIEFGFDCATEKHFSAMCLTDEEIERRLAESWHIV